MLLKTEDIKNMLMFYLIKILLDIKWKEFKVNYIELGPTMLIKFLCIVLMLKGNDGINNLAYFHKNIKSQ